MPTSHQMCSTIWAWAGAILDVQRTTGTRFVDAHETWERYVFIKTCTHTYMHTDNWALIYAQKLAMKRSVPLMVCFCLVPKFLDATIRQFGFMLKGLREVEQVRTIIQSPSSVDCHSFRTAFFRAQLNLSVNPSLGRCPSQFVFVFLINMKRFLH